MEGPPIQNVPDLNPDKGNAEEQTGNLNKSIRKATTLGIAAASLLASEGFSQEKGSPNLRDRGPAQVESDTGASVRSEGRLKEEYKRLNERNQKINSLILENEKAVMEGRITFSTNSFLQMYYQYINKGYVDKHDEAIYEVGSTMRVLEIASKKGIKLDLSKGYKCTKVAVGNVPTSASVNGVEIPISLDSDLNAKERELINMVKGGVGAEQSPDAPKKSDNGKNPIRVSPDFE